MYLQSDPGTAGSNNYLHWLDELTRNSWVKHFVRNQFFVSWHCFCIRAEFGAQRKLSVCQGPILPCRISLMLTGMLCLPWCLLKHRHSSNNIPFLDVNDPLLYSAKYTRISHFSLCAPYYTHFIDSGPKLRLYLKDTVLNMVVSFRHIVCSELPKHPHLQTLQ